jgi:hypothetical protein
VGPHVGAQTRVSLRSQDHLSLTASARCVSEVEPLSGVGDKDTRMHCQPHCNCWMDGIRCPVRHSAHFAKTSRKLELLSIPVCMGINASCKCKSFPILPETRSWIPVATVLGHGHERSQFRVPQSIIDISTFHVFFNNYMNTLVRPREIHTGETARRRIFVSLRETAWSTPDTLAMDKETDK